MEKYNYLGNLPRKNYELSKGDYNEYLNFIIDKLLNAEYKTDNQVLRSFKDSFSGLMIRKLYHGYDLNNYFDIKNALSQLPEYLIISLYDELIFLLNKDDLENLKMMESLTKIHEFSFLNSRVKTDNGFISQTRNINLGDIYHGITSISREMESFVTLYVKRICSSQMTLVELKILKEMITDSTTMAYYNKFNEKFGKFKNCGVKAYEKLYDIYYQELKYKLITNIDKQINKIGFTEDKIKEREYSSHISNYRLRSEKNKRTNWYRY